MYGQPRLGDISPASFFESTVQTPAEKTAQYTMLGAIGAAGVAVILMYAGGLLSPKNRPTAALLIAAPVLGVGAGLLAVKREYS